MCAYGKLLTRLGPWGLLDDLRLPCEMSVCACDQMQNIHTILLEVWWAGCGCAL
jgi:hypothetical protein